MLVVVWPCYPMCAVGLCVVHSLLLYLLTSPSLRAGSRLCCHSSLIRPCYPMDNVGLCVVPSLIPCLLSTPSPTAGSWLSLRNLLEKRRSHFSGHQPSNSSICLGHWKQRWKWPWGQHHLRLQEWPRGEGWQCRRLLVRAISVSAQGWGWCRCRQWQGGDDPRSLYSPDHQRSALLLQHCCCCQGWWLCSLFGSCF